MSDIQDSSQGAIPSVVGFFLSLSLKSCLICAAVGSSWSLILGHLDIPLEDQAWACPAAAKLQPEMTSAGCLRVGVAFPLHLGRRPWSRHVHP